jgi:hypothetical protein
MNEEKGLSRDEGPILTLEAQQAIRQFLWKYIGPSGIVLVLISGFVGFFVRDIAVKTAAHEAFASVHTTTMEMAKKTIEAKTQAEEAVKQVKDLQESAKSQVEKVDKQMQILDEKARQLTSTIVNLENQAKEAATILVGNPNHLRKIAECLAADQRVTQIVQEFLLAKEDSLRKIDVAREQLQTMKPLQIECKKGTIRSRPKQTKFTFKFPVQQVWIEYVGPAPSPLEMAEKIEGDTVTLIRQQGDGGWIEDDVTCKVCAAGS